MCDLVPVAVAVTVTTEDPFRRADAPVSASDLVDESIMCQCLMASFPFCWICPRAQHQHMDSSNNDRQPGPTTTAREANASRAGRAIGMSDVYFVMYSSTQQSQHNGPTTTVARRRRACIRVSAYAKERQPHCTNRSSGGNASRASRFFLINVYCT
jgi:hypothetical protein